ncbi:hypothetical protein LCGC14_1555340 [marine sediment metagenome]|uniref:Uncharacterized protein n=1 Tax=marine sediment metagenome TaxID=412755 RepID=A0A0F9IP33_9ZZZZ
MPIKRQYKIFDKNLKLSYLTANEAKELDETFKRISKALVQAEADRKENSTLSRQVKQKKVVRNFRDTFKKVALVLAGLALLVPPVAVGWGIWVLGSPGIHWEVYLQRVFLLGLILVVERYIFVWYAKAYLDKMKKG